jgi:hypothetical protein
MYRLIGKIRECIQCLNPNFTFAFVHFVGQFLDFGLGAMNPT